MNLKGKYPIMMAKDVSLACKLVVQKLSKSCLEAVLINNFDS